MKIYTTVLAILLMSTLVIAQRPDGVGRPGSRGGGPGGAAELTLKGKVIDQDAGVPLEYATISIFRLPMNKLVNGNITDELGNFDIKVKPGNYDVKIEFLGYQEKVMSNVELKPDASVKDLGEISLASEAASLDEVIVTEEKSSMQLGLDKKIFNVGKDLSARGGNASDLLDNVPSVQVDIEGNVSLRGSGNVRILIDGMPSGLLGNGTNGLRAIQANTIEKIEVITNPSARYAAEGMAGIINIVMKKNQKKGFNGSFDATVGVPTKYGLSANLNYRANKFNFFVNYGVSYNQSPGGGFNTITLIEPDTTFITEQLTERKRGGINNNIRFGADYIINPKNTLTTAFNLRVGDEDNFATTDYLITTILWAIFTIRRFVRMMRWKMNQD